MKWQLKFVKNSLFALLPFPGFVRSVKRRIWPYPASIDEWTLEQGIRQIEMLKTVGFDIRGKVVLELGTGWQPVIPLLFHLAGAKNIILLDSERLLDVRLFAETRRNLVAYKELLATRLGIDAGQVERTLNAACPNRLAESLSQFGMTYLAPCDAGATGLPDESVDIVVSRAVLEHIPPQIIEGLFREFHRILKADGRMCHIIDNSDHWEHSDKSISKVNFLKFGDSLWSRFAINPLDYMNRLRHFEYIDMLSQTGFKLDLDLSEADKDVIEILKTLPLCDRYRSTSHAALAVLTSYIVASKSIGLHRPEK